MKNPLLIAIDGPSASGKGSLAAKIAKYFNLPYLNTGALYRAVSWRILHKIQENPADFFGFKEKNHENSQNLVEKIINFLKKSKNQKKSNLFLEIDEFVKNLDEINEKFQENKENIANFDDFITKNSENFTKNQKKSLKILEEITKNLTKDNLENDELFSEKTGEIASKIAKNPLLRKKLFKIQRDFIENSVKSHNGAVLDGRDISSIIMPEANFKFFITADVEIRADRRFKQLQEKGDLVSYQEILAQLKKRDENDKNRENSPLIIDKNAIIIDNSALNVAETFEKVMKLIENS